LAEKQNKKHIPYPENNMHKPFNLCILFLFIDKNICCKSDVQTEEPFLKG